MSTPLATSGAAEPVVLAGPDEARSLRDLTPRQWKSGLAAWLGWMFDGLDMHLYTLVAAPFVAQLLMASSPADAVVKEKSSWIQAAFLVGWALGGGFFGRLGDWLGRSRALSLTILTYAVFTGLSSAAQTWWQLMIFRFVAALGIGGEWAIGSALLSETWPKHWRPWIAAVLQTGVNLGVLGACATVYLMAGGLGSHYDPRWVFLVGVLPALMVYWVRRHVPEPEEWVRAKATQAGSKPRIRDLFRAGTVATTVRVIAVCAGSLTAWWAFMFWNSQHLRNLPEVQSWSVVDREQLVSQAFFVVIGISIVGNFFAGWLARRLGYRRAITFLLLGFLCAFVVTYSVPRGLTALRWCILLIGFFSGVFALFTMYLPPLFPTLLRTTGAGFCYNIGRVFAAAGTVIFGLFAPLGDFRWPLLLAGLLLVPVLFVAWLLPDHPVEEPRRSESAGAGSGAG